MHVARRIGGAAVIAILAAACSQPPRAFGAWYLASAVAPPRGLDRLRIGMTADEASAAVPGLARRADDGALVASSGLAEVTLRVPLDAAGEVDGVEMIVSGVGRPSILEALTRAWGEPAAEGYFGFPLWASPATGWRASVNCWNGACGVTFDAHRAVQADVFGSEPRLPGFLAPLTGDLTMDEARLAVPRLADPTDSRPRHLGGEGLRYDIEADEGQFVRIEIEMPAPAHQTVLAAWRGGLSDVDFDGNEVHVWFDPERRWRITLGPPGAVRTSVAFDRYVPVASLIGAGPPGEIPLLAMVPPGRGYHDLALPPTEWARGPTFVVGRRGDVESASVAIPYRGASARDELLALFERRWGAPTVETSVVRELVFHPRDPHVVVHDDRGALFVYVSR